MRAATTRNPSSGGEGYWPGTDCAGRGRLEGGVRSSALPFALAAAESSGSRYRAQEQQHQRTGLRNRLPHYFQHVISPVTPAPSPLTATRHQPSSSAV